jgi:chitodextrinase
MKNILRFIKLASLVAGLMLLTSCGGGGGGGNNTTPQTPTATLQAGTVAVGSTEVGTSVAVSSNSAGQPVLTVQNAGSKLTNAQAGQIMVFEGSSAMPLGFAGVVQSVQTTSVSGVATTTANFVPANIGQVFQNLNLNLNNVATNPQLVAGVALQNGVRAYTTTTPQTASGMLGTLQNGLIQLNLIANNTGTAIGVDFSSGIKATFWKVNGSWTGTDPVDPLAPKVNITFTGNVELQNPNFSQANIVIENGKLVTHNLQLKGTLKRNIKATVTGGFTTNASDLSTLFSGATSNFYNGNGYNEYSFDYKGAKIKVHGVEKDPSKIILGAAIISAAGVVPTIGTGQTGAVLKTIPVGMVVTFFMTADMNVEATASLGYQWRDMDINAGMGFSYDDSLGLPVSLLTGQYKTPVPFWDATAHLDQPEGVSYDVSGSASTTLTAGVDGGIVLVGLEIAQATVEGGIRGKLSGQFGKPVGGTLSGCYTNASVTAGVRALLDVAAGVDLKTNFQSKWLKWMNTSVATGYVYEFPMFPDVGVDYLAEKTIWSPGDDTCHIPQFSATSGAALYNYSFDAGATSYQPMVSNYAWNFGDGTTASGVTTTHTYSNSGSYTATLTVLYSDGIQKTTSRTVVVSAVPALSPAFTVSFSGLQASFNASTSTPGANITGYAWSFGDGATATGITASHIYAAYRATPWSVALTVTDSYGRTASTSQNVSATCPAGQVLLNGQCVTPVTYLGAFSAAGSLATQREGHTATLLPNGKVLVAGGTLLGASAELYDPATNTWSAAGSPATVRYYHTATLLLNGKVLIAGGSLGGTPDLASAELYDPTSNTWSAAGSLASGRYYHTATLLPNGKVLVAGGRDSNTNLASVESYDPVSNTWSAAGNLSLARSEHTATLLPNGKVLVAAGAYAALNYVSAELYDPATNIWSAAGSLVTGRYAHAAILLPSGKVLVAGGWDANSLLLASAELYDPASNTWVVTGSLATARWWHTVTLLPNGKVLVSGGNGQSISLSSAELFW